MTEPISTPPERLFPDARTDVQSARLETITPQTASPAYQLAFQDKDFLLRADLRPVRFQLELLKPELLLDEAGIKSTLVFYGSARIPAPDEADALVAVAPNPAARAIAERLKANARYYDEARKLAFLASSQAPLDHNERHYVVCSGGGPSIMEAANRGAAEAGQQSIGLNIVLAHEQVPNSYVTPELSFRFHYFALRKMHFLMRARAVAVFPGGFGTLDELMELLTLVQTGKMEALPIVLFGKSFWDRIVGFDALVEEGVISPDDLNLFRMVETADEAWAYIADFYASDGVSLNEGG